MTDLTVAEYFAGIGLIRMGLETCSWRVVFTNDISVKKYEIYKGFFPDAEPHYWLGDVFGIDPTRVPKATLATCSFPCIDLSLAGNMNGLNGEHSSAFWGFVQALQTQGEAAPPLVLVENVSGWLYSNGGKDFRLTVKALNDLGYTCDVFTLDALRFTPQSRPRVFLVGIRGAISDHQLERILSRPRALLSEQLRKSILSNLDLQWFYTTIPAPPPLRTEGLSEIVENIEETDARWWSEGEVKRHLAMMEESHFKRVMQLAQAENTTYRPFFRRRRKGLQRAEVRHDDLAGCLRTAVGGNGKQFLIKVGNSKIKMRAMTPREYARLQGVPDHFPIVAEGVQALTGFGDAVCVPAITWIAENILNPLAKQYLSTELQTQ